MEQPSLQPLTLLVLVLEQCEDISESERQAAWLCLGLPLSAYFNILFGALDESVTHVRFPKAAESGSRQRELACPTARTN